MADGWDVIATAREPSPDLDSIGVRFEQLEMLDFEALANFGERINTLDLLIANAGTFGPKDAAIAADGQGWLDTFAVNTIAPYLLARSVLPHVTKSHGKLIAISSRMGSIQDNQSGGYLAYRSSKTALNSAWRNLALEIHVQLVWSRPLFIPAGSRPEWADHRLRCCRKRVFRGCGGLSLTSAAVTAANS